MALETTDVRIKVPEDLDVVLQALANDAGMKKTTFATDVILKLCERELAKQREIYSGLKERGLQSQIEERRVLSGRQSPRDES